MIFRTLAATAFSPRRSALTYTTCRGYTQASPVSSVGRQHRVVVVGAGSAGLSISHQLLQSGKFSKYEIAIIDPSTKHDYQPGWTLVGGGLKDRKNLLKPLSGLLHPSIKFYNQGVSTFSPAENSLSLENGGKISYEHLVVVPGIKINYDSIEGLPEALANPGSLVSTIYGYETCEKVFHAIQKFRKGNAVFTQPAGVVKCAEARTSKSDVARFGLLESSRLVRPLTPLLITGQDKLRNGPTDNVWCA